MPCCKSPKDRRSWHNETSTLSLYNDPYHNTNDGTSSSDATAGISEWVRYSLYPGKKPLGP
jgi:hypothetical protein